MTSSTAVEVYYITPRYQFFLDTASQHRIYIQPLTIFKCTTQNILTFISEDSVT
jgi:hypothetical protein